jgi:hypothetical protein
MSKVLYPPVVGPEDDGTMPANVAEFADAIVGHRIIKVERDKRVFTGGTTWQGHPEAVRADVVFTLDTGQMVALKPSGDCCAFTDLEDIVGNLAEMDHVVTRVKPSEGYDEWHILADCGEVMRLKVNWSAGNPFYYCYGFTIRVLPLEQS